MKITDMNTGEQFLQLEVFIIVYDVKYGMFVMNEPVALNKWMLLLIPNNHKRKPGDAKFEVDTYAFETSIDCTRVPVESAKVWCKKAMTNLKNNSINTSRPLSCYLYNIDWMSEDYSVTSQL